MDAARLNIYTVNDIEALPEGQRAELIDGFWYDMASPNPTHQEIISNLSYALTDYIKKHHGKCQVFPAPFAVYLQKDNRNYLEPDIVVLCDKDKLSKRGCEGAPDLVIEVTSESTQRRDYGVKLFKYRNSGVREYWIVNPDVRTVNTFEFPDSLKDDEAGEQHSFNEEIAFALYPDLTVKLDDMITWTS